MYFERVLPVLSFCAALLFSGCLPGCPLHINETPPESSVVDLGADSGCLSGADEMLRNYFAGHGNADTINRFFRCASRSLDMFVERTRGSEPGRYTPDELRSFLERHFLNGSRISDGFLRDTMALKQSFWGGSDRVITVDEIERVKSLFEVLRDQAIQLLPYQPISATQVLKMDQAALDQIAKALLDAGMAIGSVIPENASPYSFEKLENLLFEIEQFYAGGDSKINLRDHLPLFQILKSTLLGSSGHGLEGNDWRRLFRVVPGWYGLFLRMAYLQDETKGFDWTHGEGHVLFAKILKQGHGLIEDAILHQQSQTITFAQLDELINRLLPNGISTSERYEAMPVAMVKDYVKLFFKKIMAPELDAEARAKISGLSLDGLKRLWSSFDEWVAAQHLLEELFARLPKDKEEVAGYFSVSTIQQEIATMQSSSKIELEEGLLVELKKLVWEKEYSGTSSWPSGWLSFEDPNNPNEIMFNGYRTEQNTFQSLKTLSEMNWKLRLAKLLIKPYSADFGDKDKDFAASIDDIAALERDFRALLVDRRMMHPSRKDIYKSRFIEANLFTAASFGNSWVSVSEGTHVLALMISAKHWANRFHEDISQSCTASNSGRRGIQFVVGANGLPERDYFGGLQILQGCYWDKFYAEMLSNKKGYFNNVPKMAEHYQGLNGEGRKAFRATLESLVRGSASSEAGIVDSADSETVTGVIQYIEAIFSRFDSNNDSEISFDEARAMFPVFRSVIGQIAEKSGLKEEIDFWNLFIYLLAFGEEPKDDWTGVNREWIDWRYLTREKTQRSKVHATRSILLKLFYKVTI